MHVENFSDCRDESLKILTMKQIYKYYSGYKLSTNDLFIVVWGLNVRYELKVKSRKCTHVDAGHYGGKRLCAWFGLGQGLVYEGFIVWSKVLDEHGNSSPSKYSRRLQCNGWDMENPTRMIHDRQIQFVVSKWRTGCLAGIEWCNDRSQQITQHSDILILRCIWVPRVNQSLKTNLAMRHMTGTLGILSRSRRIS